jgi:pimeloyl-ACP methyl ester carboxylesterase
MTRKSHLHPADVYGISRLAVEATLGLTDLIEATHAEIAYAPGLLGPPTRAATHGIAGLVYASIRTIARLIGSTADTALGPLIRFLGEPGSSPEREGMLATLNGILGDHLTASSNPLTIPMRMCRDGQPLDLAPSSLTTTIPQPRSSILLLVHGLCLNDLQWLRKRHDHGARLATDLGYTQVYLHYNTGLHISANGRAFADMIEILLEHWPVPVEKLVIVGHSMGGLVARSACHYGALAGHTWLRQLQTIVFLGAPHHGATLERVGNWIHGILGTSPYTAAFARLGQIRSAGITDLRYGNLLDEDWAERDRFTQVGDQRQAVPLPEGVQCCTIAATIGKTVGDLPDQLLGDGLVPLGSALGYHMNPSLALRFPQSQRWIGYEMNHMDLLDRQDVYQQLVQWLAS